MTDLTPKEERQIHDFARDVRALVERQVRDEIATAIEERGRRFLPGHPAHPYVAEFAGIARGQAVSPAAADRPLLDPLSFDTPAQRAAARALNAHTVIDAPADSPEQVADDIFRIVGPPPVNSVAAPAAVCPVCQHPACCCSCFGKTPRPDCTHGGAR